MSPNDPLEVLLGLKCLSLDAMHLCFRVDNHTRHHRIRPSVVGLVMRSSMRKFTMPERGLSRSDRQYYSGGLVAPPTMEEREAVNHIRLGDLPKKKAVDIIRAMDLDLPMKSLEEFATLIAALVRVYPERVDTKSDKTTLRGALVASCSRQKSEWYHNEIRFRTSLSLATEEWLGSGTTRNEQLHAHLNARWRETVGILPRMLDACHTTWSANAPSMCRSRSRCVALVTAAQLFNWTLTTAEVVPLPNSRARSSVAPMRSNVWRAPPAPLLYESPS